MNDTTDETRSQRHDGYLQGRSAVRADGGWFLLDPTDDPTPETAPYLDGMAIITAADPYNRRRRSEENRERKERLRVRLHTVYRPVHPTLGSLADGPPTSWQGAEEGFAAKMSREEAALIGAEHDQEAIYMIEGGKRVLVFTDDQESIEQNYRLTWYPDETPETGTLER